jgi:membrane protease YdiL (CAAX protease family)
MIAALFAIAFLGPVIRPYLSDSPLTRLRTGVSVASYLIDLALLAGAILVFGGRGRPSLLTLSGLVAPIGGALLFAALIFAPAGAVAAYYAPVSKDFDAIDLVTLSGLYPLFEEIGFRGLALGALIGICGWRFLPAALVPAIAFGAAHFWQGQSSAEVAGVVAVTVAGGLLFGWLFVRWRNNIWPPFFIHAGLNMLWLVFALGDTAIGGWFGNALRLGVVAAAIGLTLFMTRGWAAPNSPTPRA